MKKTLLAALVCAACAGCATQGPIEYRDRYVPIPQALLQKCKTEPPPGRGTYPTLSWPDKEQAWTTYSTKQINDNTTCNGRSEQLIQWDAQQQALYNSASAPSAASAPGVAK